MKPVVYACLLSIVMCEVVVGEVVALVGGSGDEVSGGDVVMMVSGGQVEPLS